MTEGWSRHAGPMRRLCALVLLGAVLVALATPAGADERRARKVVIVAVPSLTWELVERLRPAAISDLLEGAAAASLSVRTIGPRTDVGEGYVTLGAGNRATARSGVAGAAFGPEEHAEASTAADAYARRTGERAVGSVFHLEIADVERSAARLHYGAEPGSLGQALAEADLQAAVIANSDLLRGGSYEPHREAALAMMDRSGRVRAGTVSAGLRTGDVAWPFGVRSDDDAVAAAFDDALATSDVVLVEASDMPRVDAYRKHSTARAQDKAEELAVGAADRLVAHVLDSVDLERDLVLLVAPSSPSTGERLTVFAMAGVGIDPGAASSATTRRAGFVTLTDVAPTILDALGLETPDAMSGTVITSAGGGPRTFADVEDMRRVDEITRFRDKAVGPVSVAFIVFQVLVYAAAVVAFTGDRAWLRRYVGGAALVVLAMPSLVFLSGLVTYDQLGVLGYVVALFVASAALAALAWRVGRRHLLLPPALLIGSTLSVLLVDVLSGAHLQINTPFGYSPIVAGRFAGYGNLAFALVAMAAVVVGTVVWAFPRIGGSAEPPRVGPGLAVAACLFVLTLVVDGLPSLGSDVGGVLATMPAFAVTILLLAGWRVSWPRIAAIVVITGAAIAGFALVDLARPEDHRTHLGRFVERVADGDIGTILQRKAEANIGLLTSSVWTYVIPVALAFLAFLTWRRTGFLRELQRAVPGLRACLVGGVVAGVLGFALNDSGVAVPAMMFGVLLPYITWLLVRSSDSAAGRRPA